MGFFDDVLTQVFNDPAVIQSVDAPALLSPAPPQPDWFSQFLNITQPPLYFNPPTTNSLSTTIDNMSRGVSMSKPEKFTASRYHAYDDIINEAAELYHLDPKLLRAIIKQESDFNPNDNTGGAGAIGLMQLMPGTAKELGVNPYDIRENVMGGAKYFAQQLKRFNGDKALALAAYNAGPGRVIKAGYQIPNIVETKNYVNNILNKWYGSI